MKTLTTPPSPFINHSQGPSSGPSWKRVFRLNALDLDPRLGTASEQPHWITTERQLVRSLDQMRRTLDDFNQLLADAGEQPLPVHTEALLSMLGIADEVAPAGLLSQLRFAGKFFAGLWRFHSRVAAARFSMSGSLRVSAP